MTLADPAQVPAAVAAPSPLTAPEERAGGRREVLHQIGAPRRRGVRRFGVGGILRGLVLLVFLWQGVCWLGWLPPYLAATPMETAQALVDYRATLMTDAGTTAKHALLGLGIAAVSALFVACICVGRSVRSTVLPLVAGFESVPKIALAPVIITWLGIGGASKIALAAMIAFFPLVIGATRGVLDVDPNLLDVAQMWRLPRWRVLVFVRLPNAAVPLFDGARLALPGAVIGSVLGEFIGSTTGLGHRILVSNSALRLDLAFAAIVCTALVSTAASAALGLLERRVLSWRGRDS